MTAEASPTTRWSEAGESAIPVPDATITRRPARGVPPRRCAGENFECIPELRWAFGYPFALALMVLSAIVPYYYFKRRRWF